MQVPRQWPNEGFDLIVLSEVLYFLSPADIAATADHVVATLEPAGIVLLVNWRGGRTIPAPATRPRRSSWIARGGHGRCRRTNVTADYRLDVLRRDCGQP